MRFSKMQIMAQSSITAHSKCKKSQCSAPHWPVSSQKAVTDITALFHKVIFPPENCQQYKCKICRIIFSKLPDKQGVWTLDF